MEMAWNKLQNAFVSDSKNILEGLPAFIHSRW